MPEGVRPYPRWDGPLATGPRIGVVALDVVNRLRKTMWGQVAILIVLFPLVLSLSQTFSDDSDTHTMTSFVELLNNTRWGVLVVAAVMGAPTLLTDMRSGALDLYLSRSVRVTDYLVGKVVAVFSLCTAAMFIPGMIYMAVAAFRYDKHPDGWATAIFGALLYAVLLALMVSGLALGLSGLARNARAATLILGGGFVVLDLVVSNLLENITNDPNLQILSPFAAFQQQSEWIFPDVQSGAEFPLWWGLLEVISLTILGWILLAWRRPRVRGDEPVGA
ncbi:MAG TPA: ABC transporter permease subunit [Candidatus Thermoplasmatota archaeon]|nr:ABC transporter permease subunit [Candidatus Thermoplasmatota archaeon]